MQTDTFLWGAATSSHQVEGNNVLNDWWEWERAGRVKTASGIACDHYHRFKEDFKIARSLGHNAHRFSLEWSRLEPEEGVWSMREWDHYKEVSRALRELDIEPILTLNHFTLPLWLYKKGGWLLEDSVNHFSRFAKMAIESLGNEVSYWITLNEPLVHAFLAHHRGIWPPGGKDYNCALLAMDNQVRAHIAAYSAISAASKQAGLSSIKTGLAHNLIKFFPCRRFSIADNIASIRRHRFYNRLFVQRAIRAKALDFIGLNYYTYEFIRFKGFRFPDTVGEPCYDAHHSEITAWRNSLGWGVYPKGLYDLLKDFARYRLPIMITENGISCSDDSERSKFIKEHLEWASKARKEGVGLIGYLYWSLLDNFEWVDGYGPRFGLVEVDYASQSRTVRPSARSMADYIRNLF